MTMKKEKRKKSIIYPFGKFNREKKRKGKEKQKLKGGFSVGQFNSYSANGIYHFSFSRNGNTKLLYTL